VLSVVAAENAASDCRIARAATLPPRSAAGVGWLDTARRAGRAAADRGTARVGRGGCGGTRPFSSLSVCLGGMSNGLGDTVAARLTVRAGRVATLLTHVRGDAQPRRFTARATMTPVVMSAEVPCMPMSALTRRVSGAVSVGLNAVWFVSDT
jgi:hypothetical protein